jgi:hypothetical protein
VVSIVMSAWARVETPKTSKLSAIVLKALKRLGNKWKEKECLFIMFFLVR